MGIVQSSAPPTPRLPAGKCWVGESIFEDLALGTDHTLGGVRDGTWGELAPASFSCYTHVSQRAWETLRSSGFTLKPGLCFNVCQYLRIL